MEEGLNHLCGGVQQASSRSLSLMLLSRGAEVYLKILQALSVDRQLKRYRQAYLHGFVANAQYLELRYPAA